MKAPPRYNITAVITDKRGRVLSVGKNSYTKTHPLQAKLANKVDQEHRIYLHAEIDAIVKCRHIEDAHTITVMRYDRHGNPALAKPCNICMAAINSFGIPNVEHT